MNITKISDHKLIRNEEVCDILREALKLAEKGEITAIAIAGILHNERSYTDASSCNNVAAMIGVIEYLKFRMLSEHNNS